MVSDDHKNRIKRELRAAGATAYALSRAESKYLPELIHKDEHIGGVTYGRIDGEFSMLVATDKRILFLQRMSLYTTTDELTYDVVSGVKGDDVGLFSSLTLHTRIKEFKISYANTKCVHNFIKYIEKRRVEIDGYGKESQPANSPVRLDFMPTDDKEALSFIREHELAVLSTVDANGDPNGAIVYYAVDQGDTIYILTRSESKKAKGIFTNGKVSLTIYEAGTLKTAQIQGKAIVEPNAAIRDAVFSQIVKPRNYRGKEQMPPVTKLKNGAYTIVKITPTSIRYRDYSSA